ncbi:MAG: hypothetical protein GXO60_09185 [Epsilonproteobacteria bacterium]|nr:hypothetical protein [Campylobacterota bacterium]
MISIIRKVSILLLIATLSIILYSLIKKSNPVKIVRGNLSYKPIPFRLEETNDVVCKMLIRSYYGSSQAITKSGDTYFFNDIGCMMTWLEEQPNQKSIKMWVYTNDTHRWIDAKIAHYSTTDKTTLGYGFGAYEKKLKNQIDYNEMKLRMFRGENLLNPKIRKRLLENRYN